MQNKPSLFLCVTFLFLTGLSGVAQMSSFKTVNIGNREWMSENYNSDVFQNGDRIKQATTTEEWLEAAEKQEPAWCYYNNDPANGNIYGRLYNWYAVKDERGLAPYGWHIPAYDEWLELEKAIQRGREVPVGKLLKSTEGWRDNQNGTDQFGFNGLPGGYRDKTGDFFHEHRSATWWTASEFEEDTDRARTITLGDSSPDLMKFYFIKVYGFYVRCIKD